MKSQIIPWFLAPFRSAATLHALSKRLILPVAAGAVIGLAPTLSAANAESGDGTMTVNALTNNMPGVVTNVIKFSFRCDGVGTWLAGAQIRLTIPETWTPPQTNATGNPGFLRAVLVGVGGPVSIADISGTGPWAVTVNYAGGAAITKGFDLTYTNVTVPSAGVYEFIAASAQAGSAFTNLAASPAITVITRETQVIDFPAVGYGLTPGMTVSATASSGLPVTFTKVSGPYTLAGSVLTFSNTGTVKIAASQAGNIAWHPATTVTNTFPVYAGGTMTLSPALATANCSTNGLKFKFRCDDIATWPAGAQVQITIPATWPQPQTNSAAGSGFVKAASISATAVSIDSISGTGPWDVTVNLQSANDNTRGFDLVYTNITTPAAGLYSFETACQQRGVVYTNAALNRTIELVDGAEQTIDFPALEDIATPNTVTFEATASSGLPVSFSATGPVSGSGSTRTLTGTGIVTVVASQVGTAYWLPAPSITNSFRVFAGGTLTLTPALVFAGTATNLLKFSFRNDGVGDWAANSQIRLTVPAGWTPPQTNSAGTPGHVKAVTAGTSVTLSIADITGTGPWDVTLNYSAIKTTSKGFDLTYSNAAPPELNADYTFDPVCRQFGLSFTNPALSPTITVIVKTNQTIDFPAIDNQFATNKVVLNATASSGLPTAYTFTGPGVLAANNLTFTNSGVVSVTASQAGALGWNPAPPVTNTFTVLAGGTMTVAPASVTAGFTTNVFKFRFRPDGVGTWPAGSQVRLTVPESWSAPQTNSAAEAGYIKAVTNGLGGTLSIAEITGSGPWDLVMNYSGTSAATNRGFDVTYTNVTPPETEGVYVFGTACRQFGIDFVNPAMQPDITVIVKTNQTIDFPAIGNQLTTNRVDLTATASSGLPVTYTVGGPGTLTGGTLTFTNSGEITVTALQNGDGDWHPAIPVTNTFYAFAGGSMSLTPAAVTEGSATNLLKFSFRGDGAGTWPVGSKVYVTIPADWTEPQTNSASTPGFLRAKAMSATTATVDAIIGEGPWTVRIDYQGGKEITRGFDLTYTNAATPVTPGAVLFETYCRQYGQNFTNQSLDTSILLMEGSDQTITFPPIPGQLTTNKVVLDATASSGLPIAYMISGPFSLTGGTNLTFTGTGVVSVVAAQAGNLSWHSAVSITNTFRVFAGGVMTLTPEALTTGTATNQIKFAFRGDGLTLWGAGSQLRFTIPVGWTPPQTNAPAGPGYVKATLVSAYSVKIDSIIGTGPWFVTVNYQQTTTHTTRGFDLTYSNVAPPSVAGPVVFEVLCRQSGDDFANPALNQEILLVEGQNQTIDFPAIAPQITTNKMTLKATASSGLTVSYAVQTTPASIVTVASGSNLTFIGTGSVTVVASQAGNLNWLPAAPVTNQFHVLAGGTMALSPVQVRSGSTTNWLKFAFRGDGVGAWAAGSQIRITVPGTWPEPQTNSASGPGYLKITPVSAITVSIDSITGTGPWDVVVNHQAADDITRGFDLAYTNITMPAPGLYPFDTECRQFGHAVTNEVLNRSITVVEGADQTIAFPEIADQIATNKIGLIAAATSGLPVIFAVQSGPAAIATATNLSFTGTGTVVVTATQIGALYWNPASTSCSFSVSPAILVPTATVKTKTYDGTTDGATNTITLAGKAAGDTVTAPFGATAVFADKHIGSGKPVIVSDISLTGSSAAKYQLSTTTVAATGTITARAITVRAATDNTKVYDGTTASAVSPTITVGTLGAGDTGIWSQTFDTRNVGTGKILTPAGTVSDDNGGTNYAITFTTRATGVIVKKPVTVSGAAVTPKTYDGTKPAAITGGVLVGGIEGDSVLATGSTGKFAQADAGESIAVTPVFTLTGTDAGNYSLTQPALTGTITPKAITVTGASALDKVYDGTTGAVITNGVLNGLVGGDIVSLDALAGAFAQSTAGANLAVTAALTITGADAGNYTVTQPEGLAAAITPKALTVTGATALDKDYDGTTAATIANAVLDGVISGDDVTLDSLTGVFASAEIGTGIAVTATLTITGAASGNYTLTQPIGLTAAILDSQPLVITGGSSETNGVGERAFRLSWNGRNSCSYHVEYKDRLGDASWSMLPGCTGIPGTNGTISAVDTNQPEARFYRLRMTTP